MFSSHVEEPPHSARAERGIEDEVLAQVGRCLARSDVTLDDDFFRLGGDSLLAMRLLSRLNEAFDVELSPAAIFRSPTPRLLAAEISDATCERGASGLGTLIPLNRHGRGAPIYMVHGTFADPWVFRPLVDAAQFRRPVFAVRAPDLDWEQDVMTTKELADHYVTEIRRLQRRGSYTLTGYSFGGQLAFEMAHRLLRDGQEVSQLVMLDTCGPARLTERIGSKERVLTALVRLACRSDSLAGPALDWIGCRSPLRRAFFCLGIGPLTVAELRRIVRVAFPAYAARTDLSARTFHELCAILLEQFKRVLSEREWAQLASHALPQDPVALVKAHKVWAKNHWSARSYRPSGIYPHTITIFACAGNVAALRWQRFSAKPLDLRWIPAARAAKGAHAEFLDSASNELVARDLRELLEGRID